MIADSQDGTINLPTFCDGLCGKEDTFMRLSKQLQCCGVAI